MFYAILSTGKVSKNSHLLHLCARTSLSSKYIIDPTEGEGEWGTVCNYYGNWDMTDARVACRQLGFTKTVGYWDYGRGTGKVWLYGMGCSGSETSLGSCSHNTRIANLGLVVVTLHCGIESKVQSGISLKT